MGVEEEGVGEVGGRGYGGCYAVEDSVVGTCYYLDCDGCGAWFGGCGWRYGFDLFAGDGLNSCSSFGIGISLSFSHVEVVEWGIGGLVELLKFCGSRELFLRDRLDMS